MYGCHTILNLNEHWTIFARDIVDINIVFKLFDGFVQALFHIKVYRFYITFIDYDGVVET